MSGPVYRLLPPVAGARGAEVTGRSSSLGEVRTDLETAISSQTYTLPTKDRRLIPISEEPT